MSFEITFIGVSGGPLDGRTCATLMKPAEYTYSQIIEREIEGVLLAVDGGSGIGRLTDIILHERISDGPFDPILNMYKDYEELSDHLKILRTTPFKDLTKQSVAYSQAVDIYNLVGNFLITHPHLDHIAALTINTTAFKRKPAIYGSEFTISALRNHVFNGIIWPKMESIGIASFHEVPFCKSIPINEFYSITMFELSHGNISTSKASEEHYFSSAFLINYAAKGTSILIFGDFESDSSSKLKNNQKIWSFISTLVSQKQISAIILECSLNNDINSDELYGHMTPNHLIDELRSLEKCCKMVDPKSAHPLQGLNVIINHVKETCTNSDPRMRIVKELEDLNASYNLGISFSVAIPGVSICV